MSENKYEYEAELVRVVDADSVYFKLAKVFSMEIDFGFNITDEMLLKKEAIIYFRLFGINAPEITGATKVAGLAAKAELEHLLSLGKIRVVSYKPDKYGRYLADVYVQPVGDDSTPEIHINQQLIATGHAVPYMV